jgi:quercetin dioxygenase-like cupin family protein
MKIAKLILLIAWFAPCCATAQQAKVTPLMSKDLNEFPGKEGVMIAVEYPPGASESVHRHNAYVFVYVIQGAVVMQARGEKEVTLNAGQTFYEAPNDVHVIGRNASKTKSAKFIAFLVKDKGARIHIPVNRNDWTR